MGNPVVHFEIVGKDHQALQQFYKEAFDWRIGSAPGAGIPYAMAFPDGGAGIDGGIGAAPEGYAGHVTFYVGVSDIDAALKKIHGLGGETMMGPEKVPDGPTIALFRDPEGHLVGLVQLDTMRAR